MKGTYVHFKSDKVVEYEGKELDMQYFGDVVTLRMIADDAIAGTTWSAADFQITGPAEFVEVANPTSPGASIQVRITGVGSYHVEGFSAADTASESSYWGNRVTYDCTTMKVQPRIEFTEDPSKAYDGMPVTTPGVQITTSNPENNPDALIGSEVTYSYNTSDGNAPTDVGDYVVTASVAETSVTTAASAKSEFTISPAPTAVALELSQDGTTGTAKATVAGLYERTGTVTFMVNDEKVGEPVQLDNDFCATLTQYDLPANTYTVTAQFNPESDNYSDSEATATGTQQSLPRSIDGTKHYTKAYGDESFELDLSLSAGSGDLTYEVAWDAFTVPSVKVDNSGNVTINHAGSSLIKASVTSDGTYQAASTYVLVRVTKAEATITSYVHDSSNQKVGTVTYGSLVGLSSALKFAGLKTTADRADFAATFSAAPLAMTTQATQAYAVPILCNSTPNRRDYHIAYGYELLAINKREIVVNALPAEGTYGGEEPQYAWEVSSTEGGGLARCDTEESVFDPDAQPMIGPSQGRRFRDLDAGTYEDAIEVSGGESSNYTVTAYRPSTLVVSPANIRDSERFHVSVEDSTYNGNVQQQPVTVTDTALGKKLTLVTSDSSGDVAVNYRGEQKYAGRVWAIVRGLHAYTDAGNYTGSRVQAYSINKAPLTVKTDSATKLYDGMPLTASGTVDGILNNDATFEVTGSQTEVGVARNGYELVFVDDQTMNSYRIHERLGILWVRSNILSQYNLSQPDDVRYDGQEHRVPITLTDGDGTQLIEGVDFDATYQSDTGNLVDVGTITVTVTGKGAYRGQKTTSYAIEPAPIMTDTLYATKVWDGTPLTAPGSMSGLVAEQTATLVTTGSQTEVGSSPNTYRIAWDGTAKQSNYEVTHEDIGVLKVTPEGVTYRVTSGDGSTWTKGSDKVLTFVVKRSAQDDTTFAHFTDVYVDGSKVSANDYTAEAGSVIIRLKPTLLQSLAAGNHTTKVCFDDGSASAKFSVKSSSSALASASGSSSASTQEALSRRMPDTGDSIVQPFLFVALGMTALLAARRRVRRSR